MRARHTVFVPIVPPNSGKPEGRVDSVEGELIEIYSNFYASGDVEQNQWDRKAIELDFDRVAAPLRSSGAALYEAGCAAAGALLKMGLKRPFFACYQWLRPQAWVNGQRLQTVNPRGPHEGQSAQLGLALALFLRASSKRRQPVIVISTGALVRDRKSGTSSAGLRQNDVEVLPVGELRAKLRLVLNRAREGVFRSREKSGERVYFFTPTGCVENGRVLNLDHLEEVGELKVAGVDVVPIRWLSEAAKRLGISRRGYLTRDHICQVLAASILTLGLFGAAWFGWRQFPINMTFSPNDLIAQQKPFQVCNSSQKDVGLIPLKYDDDGLTPMISAGGTLGWEVKLGEPLSLDAKIGSFFGFAGYYLAHVLVSEHSPPMVKVPTEKESNTIVRVFPGGTYAWKWRLNEQDEDNALILLAQRHGPFDADALTKKLGDRFFTLNNNLMEANERSGIVADVANLALKQAPGALTFYFKTVGGYETCTK